MIDVEGIVPQGWICPKKHFLLEKSDKEDQQNSTQKTNFSRNSMNEAASVEGNGQMMPWFRAFLQSLKKWSDPKHHLPMYLQRCCLTHQIPPHSLFFCSTFQHLMSPVSPRYQYSFLWQELSAHLPFICRVFTAQKQICTIVAIPHVSYNCLLMCKNVNWEYNMKLSHCTFPSKQIDLTPT